LEGIGQLLVEAQTVIILAAAAVQFEKKRGAVVGWPRDERLDFWPGPLGIIERFVKKDGDEGNCFSDTHRAKRD
jgi:hypothetical protein